MKTPSETGLKNPPAATRPGNPMGAPCADRGAAPRTRSSGPKRLFELTAKPSDLRDLRGGSAVRQQWRLWACALLGLGVASGFGAAVPAASTPAPAAPTDFSAFRIVVRRNIFNTGRQADTDQQPVQPVRRVEYVAFSGTMTDPDGTLAVFDGTSPEWWKVLKSGATIAGCKVLDVQSDNVKIEANGKAVDLTVGQQLRRVNGGEWEVAWTGDSPLGGGPSFLRGGPGGGFGGPGGGGFGGPGMDRQSRMNFQQDQSNTDPFGGGRQRGGGRGGRGGGGRRGGGFGGGGGGFGGGGFGGGDFGGGGADYSAGQDAGAVQVQPTTPAASGPPDPSVLQRLMQQRQQEMSGKQD